MYDFHGQDLNERLARSIVAALIAEPDGEHHLDMSKVLHRFLDMTINLTPLVSYELVRALVERFGPRRLGCQTDTLTLVHYLPTMQYLIESCGLLPSESTVYDSLVKFGPKNLATHEDAFRYLLSLLPRGRARTQLFNYAVDLKNLQYMDSIFAHSDVQLDWLQWFKLAMAKNGCDAALQYITEPTPNPLQFGRLWTPAAEAHNQALFRWSALREAWVGAVMRTPRYTA
jgi:hypothetical protein